MKLFLVGEGKTDCGLPGPDGWLEGPVQCYIRRIRADAALEIITVHKAFFRDMRGAKRQRRSLKGLRGHSVKAFLIAQTAAEHGCDAAAMYLDADRPDSGRPKDPRACQQRYDALKQEVLEGLCRGASRKPPAITPVAIIPVKMIECWLLGDAAAFRECYGKIPSAERYFRDPELLWGDENDPQSDFPKNKLRRALQECGQDSCRETFAALADAASPETLCVTCPISFRDFYEQVKAL